MIGVGNDGRRRGRRFFEWKKDELWNEFISFAAAWRNSSNDYAALRNTSSIHRLSLSLFLPFLPFPSPLNIYNDVIWFVSRGKKFEKESSGR